MVGVWEAAAGLALVAALSALATWAARRYALARELLDHPGERRSHRVATPRGGGVAIVAGMLCVLGAMWANGVGQRPLLLAGACGLLVVAVVGGIDDHRALSARMRLAAHTVAGALLAWAAWHAGLAPGLATALGIASIASVNAWNFMDGIDGMATLQAMVVAGGIALVSAAAGAEGSSWLAAGLVAACLGFLPFNFPKARIFLGDVGSGALGYAVALLAAMAMVPKPAIGWTAVIAVTPFAVDTALTLARRMLARERWWEAHASHRYQAWARSLGRHWPVALAYTVWSMAGIALFAILQRGSTIASAVVVVGWYVLTGLVWWVGRGPGPLATRDNAR